MRRNRFIHAPVALMAAAMFGWSAAPARSQAGAEPRPTPVDASVDVPATGERAQVSGTALVSAAITPQDGAHYRLSYGCDVAGHGRGEMSGEGYELVGHTSSVVVFDGPLPATVSAGCAVELTQRAATQRYDIAVEVLVLPDGTIGTTAVRQVVATR